MRALAALGALLMVAAMQARADMIDSTDVPLWEHCALCHGLDGVSRMAKFPKLAGQRYAYLAKQLRDFKVGHRTNDGGPMDGITHQFGMAPLLQAARWFSQLPDPPAAAAVPEAAAAGRVLFERGKPGAGVPPCQSCHGANAWTTLTAPRLEAQHRRYLEKQLRDFSSRARANDPDGIMRGVASSLTEREIAAVAAYLASRSGEREARP